MGFDDTRGTLFFEIARILKEKKPPAFLLENVKNLKSHDRGKTFKVIINTLEKDLGYSVFAEVLNAKNFGVPQNRERILIVGFKKDLGINNFKFPKSNGKIEELSDILEKDVPINYFISKIRYEGMKRHKKRHQSKGNGFGYRILDPNGVAGAIVLGGMGRERNLIADSESFFKLKNHEESDSRNKDAVRYLTPREYARLQGFPDSFKIPVSNSQAYRQFANSVPIPMIKAVALEIKKSLEAPEISRKFFASVPKNGISQVAIAERAFAVNGFTKEELKDLWWNEKLHIYMNRKTAVDIINNAINMCIVNGVKGLIK